MSGNEDYLLGGDAYLALGAGLGVLLDVQRFVSGFVPGALGPGMPQPDQVRTVCMALVAEVIEIADGLGWKPWKPVTEPDLANIAEEFADILAFLGLLVNYLDAMGLDPHTLALEYQAKSRRNIRRFHGEADGRPRIVTGGTSGE